MSKHIHADLITEYARLSHITDRPWEYFQLKTIYGKWSDCGETMNFNKNIEYRLKPRTTRIGSVDVPEPVREPLENDTDYYVPNLTGYVGLMSSEITWENHDSDYALLQRGLIHLDHKSAEIHAQALISLTQK
ncbi:conserved hypothetical protein [Xenorhabdus bovienii str. puntauvense]|uniref:Uncharacterized protein n=1 Tax=Xenorhabdus bovienii str. puntauvense TaxID=1398201 RepID=A0A077N869_XENBV|nr:hypothetical protein [Xenorhabdus bovienii]CDG98431.1 conserved hypothetical protein [Xenorhabdus bovienii str. puntauvense]